jgi:hypothetical protein
MRSSVILATISLLALAAWGEGSQGGLSGSVIDPGGAALAHATVVAKNEQTGNIYKASSSAQGKFALAGLPPGAYDISVNVPGLRGYQRKNVKVRGTKTTLLEIQIQEGTQLSTLGEDARHFAEDAKLHQPPSGPTPRTADGKPDFSGVWWGPRTVDPGKPEFLPSARTTQNPADSPQTHCEPAAATRLGPLYEFVQSRDIIVEISDDDSPGFHQIYLNRGHPADPNPAWYGDSVGHFEGDTLVVDRVAFDPRVWLDRPGHPHSDRLHIIERYRRPDLGHLETEITVEDPGVLAGPWVIKTASELAPHEQIYEFICTENNRDLTHLVRK